MSSVVLHLGKKDSGMPLSHAEFAKADFTEPWRYERVHGRLVVMSPSGHEHGVKANFFRSHLGAYEVQRPDIVEFVFSEAWVHVDGDTDRIVDIAVYLRGSSAAKVPRRIPDLIVEVASPSTSDRRRDYQEKRAEFERLGVKEFLVVDRFEHRVTVFRLSAGHYAETVLGPSDVYTTLLLPGFEMPLGKVL
jgi:Uma2 family endonuclease